MRRSIPLLMAFILLGFAAAAHAATITPGAYTLNNASVAGYSVTGTITLDSHGNASAPVALVFNDANFDDPGLPTFNTVSSTTTYNGLGQSYITASSNIGQIALYFNTTADASGHLNLCIGSAVCGTSAGTVDPSTLQIYGFYNNATKTSNPGLAPTNFSSGYLALATTATPEPSSLVMLGTGILGVAGAARRRFFKA